MKITTKGITIEMAITVALLVTGFSHSADLLWSQKSDDTEDDGDDDESDLGKIFIDLVGNMIMNN
jgi:hypothetical protein